MKGLGMEENEEGKRCSRAAPNPTSWIQKGKREERGRKERERERTKEGKGGGKRGFLQKNRILQIFVGII